MSDQWKKYTYRVQWSEEDGEYVGLCAEMSGLSWLAKSHEEAMSGIVRTAQEAVELLIQDGDDVPEPLISRTYSGEFKVRVPSEVHRMLAFEAAEENISMNRICSTKLAIPMARLVPKARAVSHEEGRAPEVRVVNASQVKGGGYPGTR